MTAGATGAETGSRQRAGSTELGAASDVCVKTIDVREISLLQIRMLIENLVLAHSGTQPTKQIPYGNTEAPDARFSPRFPGSTVILLIVAASIFGKL